jgi:hypothetical protein
MKIIKRKRIVCFLFAAFGYFFSGNAYSYVGCSGVKVDSLKTATSPAAAKLNNGRIKGSIVYINVPISNCKARNGEDISGGVYMVLHDVDNKQSASFGIKAFWKSLLLVSSFSNSLIDFHSSSMGKAENGFLLVAPYFLREI